ncbi:MAG TPA: EAL domain-containing protein [Gammaproteobacteria bacterium]|nr:EAL domain-containing protein [Gammaproteobacteria bacterium]
MEDNDMNVYELGSQRNTQLLDFVAHHSQDAIFLAAPDGRLFFSNPSASRLFGYTREEFLAGDIGLIWSKDALAKCYRENHADLESLEEHEEWMRDKQGHQQRVGISCASFPVGDLKRIALVVRPKSNKPYYGLRMGESLAEQSPLMIYVTDAEWQILWANSAKSIGSGFTSEELVGKPSPLRRYLGEQEPQLLEEIEEALAREGKWEGDLHSRRSSGEVYPIRAQISQVAELRHGETSRIVMLTDVSAIRETEQLLRNVSLHDPTTGLPNRAFLEHELDKALGHANPERARFYLLLMDIDSFGVVNEALGYETADKALALLTHRLHNAMGADNQLFRHTSDMFAVLAKDAHSTADIAALVSRINESVHEPIALNENQFSVSLSIGVSSYPKDGETCDELMRTANVALRRIKKRGGNGYSFYENGEEAVSRRFIRLAGPMQKAVERNEFKAVFQPIVDARTWKVTSMEALARWIRPDGKIIGPNEFIPVAECTGAIHDIFNAVLHQSCRQLRKLDEMGHAGIQASINLSPRQFQDPNLARSILEVIEEEQLSPERIHLEITENLLMENPQQKGKVLGVLQEQGIRIITDDFGTGYSSFGYLKHFNVDGIKLDRMFVSDIPGDEKGEKIISMIIAMGRELEIPIVAEGVETHAQADFLCKRHCGRLQGYLIAPPMAAEEFIEFLPRFKGLA